MHCDDKRTLHVLKKEIEKSWKLLENSGFTDQQLLEDFNNTITAYFDCKSSSE
ncbi:hypothetical protein [Nitrosopumilus sp.]|uniref:hypothetical protein n=1 Tax=Nitrosopumilus sp. TaxID=2024843 RepID=UPI00247DA38C|nr:hypothetical protein [Nitrosopumilus sp.]MCV0430148.1 hypothetical protein [Nitrosopumilus sp.]